MLASSRKTQLDLLLSDSISNMVVVSVYSSIIITYLQFLNRYSAVFTVIKSESIYQNFKNIHELRGYYYDDHLVPPKLTDLDRGMFSCIKEELGLPESLDYIGFFEMMAKRYKAPSIDFVFSEIKHLGVEYLDRVAADQMALKFLEIVSAFTGSVFVLNLERAYFDGSHTSATNRDIVAGKCDSCVSGGTLDCNCATIDYTASDIVRRSYQPRVIYVPVYGGPVNVIHLFGIECETGVRRYVGMKGLLSKYQDISQVN
jgi:hypothetical protein